MDETKLVQSLAVILGNGLAQNLTANFIKIRRDCEPKRLSERPQENSRKHSSSACSTWPPDLMMRSLTWMRILASRLRTRLNYPKGCGYAPRA